MDYTIHGVAKSWTQLSDFHFHFLDPQHLKYLLSVILLEKFAHPDAI